MRILATAMLVFAMHGAAASAADPAPPAPIQEEKAQNDPMICQSQEELGSRLKKKRVCMRRSEWAAQRQEESQMITRTQLQRNGPVGN